MMADSNKYEFSADPNGVPKRRKKSRSYRPSWDDRDQDDATGAAVATVVAISNRDQQVSKALLANIKSQEFLHNFDVLVIRTEDDPMVDAAIASHQVKSLGASDGALVARSIFDHACQNAGGEFVVFVGSNLMPQGTDWLSNLVKPMLEDPNTVAVRGVIAASRELGHYSAYRFEENQHDPLGFMALRKSAWEVVSFHKSGDMGFRWLDNAEQLGRVRVASDATAWGTLEIPQLFSEIVKDSFCNTRLPAIQALGKAIAETLGDWEAIQSRGLNDPGDSYLRAAQVRLAENISKTRFKRYFGKN
jgi:hypothetical protein